LCRTHPRRKEENQSKPLYARAPVLLCVNMANPAIQGFPHAELFWALQRHSELLFEPAWSSLGVLYMRLIPVSRPHFYPCCTRIWLACCVVPQSATNCYIYICPPAMAALVPPLTPLAYCSTPWYPTVPYAGCTKNLVDVQPRHHFPKILKISN
jgi:hypothetical protein